MIAPNAVVARLAHGCSIGNCTPKGIPNAIPNARAATNVEVANQPGLTVYPNPLESKTTIAFTLNGRQLPDRNLRHERCFGTSSSQGRGEANQLCAYQLNAAAYPAGVYLVKLATDTEVLTKRMVVQKQ
jgi:hypothetical protein